jgi:hypothetical protein
LDDFAVSFWHFGRERIFRITTASDDCERYRRIYEDVKRMSEAPPEYDPKALDKDEVKEKFEEWLDKWAKIDSSKNGNSGLSDR